jgi:PAS domain S-box-containing protein
MQTIRLNTLTNDRGEEQPAHPARAGLSGQAQTAERFTPTGLMLLVILLALMAEGAGAIIEVFWEPEAGHGGWLIHSAEIGVFLASAFFLLYLPLQKRLAEKEKSVQGLRQSEEYLQQAMQEREQHLRLALEGTSSGLWDWDLTTGKAYYSPSGERILGYQPGELGQSIKTWEELLNREDHAAAMRRLNDHLEGHTPFYESEYRQRSKSGEWLWFHSMGRVTSRDQQGRPLRMIGIFNDVTDRKRAEREIHLLWQQLDRAGENERTRLAQDLHDHLGQMVTVLQLELGGFKQALRQAEDVARCRRIIDLTAQLGHGIRNVTARLRPPALDTGLVPALEYDLERLRGHMQIPRFTFNAPGLERLRLEPECEIALFRIYQEALHNAVRHARAGTVDIRLRLDGDEIVLGVQDDGVGFDVQRTFLVNENHGGTGLVGMRERVAALGGRLELVSGTGQGTTVVAILPYRPQHPEVFA